MNPDTPTPDLTLYASGEEGAPGAVAPELSTAQGVFAACLLRVQRFFDARIAALFAHAHDHLFALARNATSDREQREHFDAMQELHGVKPVVQSGFVGGIIEAMEQLWAAELEQTKQ